MAKKTIKERYQALLKKIQAKQTEIEKIRLDIKALQLDCNHKNQYTSHCYDGSSDLVCPDCGRIV